MRGSHAPRFLRRSTFSRAESTKGEDDGQFNQRDKAPSGEVDGRIGRPDGHDVMAALNAALRDVGVRPGSRAVALSPEAANITERHDVRN